MIFQLYHTVQKTRSREAQEEFWKFEAKYGYGHKFIYKDPSLPDIIK